MNEIIHIVDGDAERNGRQTWARCGAMVWRADVKRLRGQAPTCERCLELHRDDEAGLAALLAEGGV